MKLSHIPGHEPNSKVQYSWKTSTVLLIQQYIAFYKSKTGIEVPAKDVTEQMLLDFMADDKEFQKFVKDEQAKSAGAPPAKTPEGSPAPGAGAPHPSVNTDAGKSGTPAGAEGKSPGTGLSGAPPRNA